MAKAVAFGTRFFMRTIACYNLLVDVVTSRKKFQRSYRAQVLTACGHIPRYERQSSKTTL